MHKKSLKTEKKKFLYLTKDRNWIPFTNIATSPRKKMRKKCCIKNKNIQTSKFTTLD